MNVDITPDRALRAFTALAKVLAVTPLPDGGGDYVMVDPEVFELTSIERLPDGGKVSVFRHGLTHNCVWLVRGRLHLGDGKRPQQLHAFGGC